MKQWRRGSLSVLLELGLDLRVPVGDDLMAVTTSPLLFEGAPDTTNFRSHRYEPDLTVSGHFGLRIQFDSVRLPSLR